MGKTIFSSHDINNILVDNSIAQHSILLIDEEYRFPSQEWVIGPFSQSLYSLQKFLGIETWTNDKNDCDDFARGAAFLAQVLNSKTIINNPYQAGLAFGEFYYNDSLLGPHAINVFVYIKDGDVRVSFYEPQTRSIKYLSHKEVNSGFHCKI